MIGKTSMNSDELALVRNPNPSSPCGLFLQRSHTLNKPEYDFVSFDREKPVTPPFKTLNLDPDASDSGIEILQSSNGLMLCSRVPEKYYVYNPTINQFTTLPQLDTIENLKRRPSGMTLAFDPLKSLHYKVISVRRHSCSDNRIDVYSSETRIWEASKYSLPWDQIDHTEFTCGVYWNERVHWMNSTGHVLYLNINQNRCGKIRSPRHIQNINGQIRSPRDMIAKRKCGCPLVKSCDSLLFIDIFSLCNSNKIDVYEMNTDYSGWLKKHHVDLSYVISIFPEIPKSDVCYSRLLNSFSVHCLVSGEREEEDAFVVLEISGMFIRYNLGLKTCEKLCDLNSSPFFELCDSDEGLWTGAFLFIESVCRV